MAIADSVPMGSVHQEAVLVRIPIILLLWVMSKAIRGG